jgi:hypothetical protein
MPITNPSIAFVLLLLDRWLAQSMILDTRYEQLFRLIMGYEIDDSRPSLKPSLDGRLSGTSAAIGNGKSICGISSRKTRETY